MVQCQLFGSVHMNSGEVTFTPFEFHIGYFDRGETSNSSEVSM